MTLLFNGLRPSVEQLGVTLEVHADFMVKLNDEWHNRLLSIGLEADPFIIFHPNGYEAHYTGRLRIDPKQLKGALPGVRDLMADITRKARQEGVPLYLELELALETHRFNDGKKMQFIPFLDHLEFNSTGKFGQAGADIHIEWNIGEVPINVRDYLLSKRFYWVSTPTNDYFPSEEIATLQTEDLVSAKQVYAILKQNGLPNCKAVHLEQKLPELQPGEFSSLPGLPMPEVVRVTRAVLP